MPPKRTQLALFSNMDAKIAALEEEIVRVKTTLAAMEKNHAMLIARLEKNLGKSVVTKDGDEVNMRSHEEGWERSLRTLSRKRNKV